MEGKATMTNDPDSSRRIVVIAGGGESLSAQIAKVLSKTAERPGEVRHHYAHTRFKTPCDPLVVPRALGKRRRTR